MPVSLKQRGIERIISEAALEIKCMLIKESRKLVSFPEIDFVVDDMGKLREPKNTVFRTFYINSYGGMSQCMIISDKGIVVSSPESSYMVLLPTGLYSFSKAECYDVNSTADYLAFTEGNDESLNVKYYPLWDSILEDAKNYISYGEAALDEIRRRL